MSEEVIIGGFGNDRSFPDFATEATQKGIMQEAGKHSNAFAQMVRLLSAQAAGQKISQSEYKEIQKELRNNRKATDALKKQNDSNDKKSKKQDDNALEEDKKQTSLFKKLLIASVERTQLSAKQFREEMKNDKRMQELMKEGMSSDSAGIMAKLEGFGVALAGVGKLAGPLATAVTGVATAVTGINAYMKAQAQDRFNFAQELRQSGLAAGLSSSQASLTSFASTVRENNFTLGEAAEFTQRFANSVGVLGVKSSLEFVNSLAYAGEGGADMMRRFGMEFGEVANVAGTYLDSVRNLGMLDRMNGQQLRTNMDDFMSTVVSTSNVMKINMEDAAKMIADTLGRTDIASLLATMDPQRAAQVQEVVGMAGGMDSPLGEALAMRLAAGSQGEFQMTSQYADLMSSPITASIMPLVEQLATSTEQGGVSGFQSALAGSRGDIQSAIDGASRELLLSGDQIGQAMIASFAKLLGTVEDANAGFTALSGDDKAVLGSIEASRQFELALQGVNNAFIENADLEQNLGKLNTANVQLAGEIEGAGSAIAQHADSVIGVTTGLQSLATNLASGVVGLAGDGLGFLSKDSADSLANVKRMRQVVEDTFGATSLEAISAPILKQLDNVEEAQARLTADPSQNNEFRLKMSQRALFDEIDELSETNPEQAQSLLRGSGLENFVREGEIINYDPAILEQQGSEDIYGNQMRNREGFELLGGGTMLTKDDTADALLSDILQNGNNTLGTDFTRDAFNQLLNGNGSGLLDTIGFEREGDSFTAEEKQMIVSLTTQMSEKKLIDDETLNKLITSISEDSGRSAFDWAGASEEDRVQQRALQATMNQLLQALTSN